MAYLIKKAPRPEMGNWLSDAVSTVSGLIKTVNETVKPVVELTQITSGLFGSKKVSTPSVTSVARTSVTPDIPASQGTMDFTQTSSNMDPKILGLYGLMGLIVVVLIIKR